MKEKIEQPNYYAIIPASVRYDERLRASEKLMYGEITALSNKDGYCYASNNYFAKLYGVYPSAITKWVQDLEKYSYVELEYIRNGKEIKQRNIKIIGIHKYEQVVTKAVEGYSQKAKENNTSINNSSSSSKENELFDFIQYNLGIELNPIEFEIVNKWEDSDLTRYVIEQASLNRAKSIKYISKVLSSYKKDGITTVEEAQQRDELYRNKKNNKFNYEKKPTHNVTTIVEDGVIRIV